MEDNVAKPLLSKLAALPEYKDAFISGQRRVHLRPAGALLVVVDTNRPDLVESEQLLDACNRVAVIDHHRRAANYIESAALNFHEPYASSASELVTELLQYLADPTDLLRAESEALLAGIVLDTKNFTMRTGGRTFEAAAFLRRAGADTSDVQRLFQSDLAGMVERYDIIRHAELVHGDIAVAAVEKEIDRVTAAKAGRRAFDALGHSRLVRAVQERHGREPVRALAWRDQRAVHHGKTRRRRATLLPPAARWPMPASTRCGRVCSTPSTNIWKSDALPHNVNHPTRRKQI